MKLSKPEDMDDLGVESGKSEGDGGSDGPVMVTDPISEQEVPVSVALDSLMGQLYSEIDNLSERIRELEEGQ